MISTIDATSENAELDRLVALAREETRALLAEAEAKAKRLDPAPLLALAGTFDSMMTNVELDEMRRPG